MSFLIDKCHTCHRILVVFKGKTVLFRHGQRCFYANLDRVYEETNNGKNKEWFNES